MRFQTIFDFSLTEVSSDTNQLQYLPITVVNVSSVWSPVSYKGFMVPAPLPHTHIYFFFSFYPGYREGFLWKRGRDNGQFLSRKFVLSEREGALKYFNKQDVRNTIQPIAEFLFGAQQPYWGMWDFYNSLFTPAPVKARDPKAIMKIETLNATFQPAKIGNPCGLQITYLKDNSTRNIFVYHSDAKVRTCMYYTHFCTSNSKLLCTLKWRASASHAQSFKNSTEEICGLKRWLWWQSADFNLRTLCLRLWTKHNTVQKSLPSIISLYFAKNLENREFVQF